MTTGWTELGPVGLVVFEVLRAALRVLLVVLCLHFLRAAWTSFRARDPAAPAPLASLPRVTVQIPVRNEYYVVERVVRAASALRYPRELLQIQVLDDSSDETTARASSLCDELRELGVDIECLHRDDNVGYKAGALNAALPTATGQFIAMFDADCVPPADFLERTLPWFGDATVACVQVRWSFLNREHSVLTRVQALVLDGLFAVDQFSRAVAGLPLQFNGTNGVWRRSAVDEIGGWNPQILAEDADLSFRAYLLGHRVQHVRDYAVPTEIPTDMAAFRAQQRRWALGSAQMLRALSLPILRSKLPARAKLMMFMHLGRHGIDPLILLACLSSPFTTLFDMPFLVDYSVASNLMLIGFVGLATTVFYARALDQVRAPMRHVVLVPLIVLVAIGLSLVYTVAFVRGLLQRGGPFVRTPKAGDERPGAGPRYRAPMDGLAVAELLIAAAHAAFAWLAAQAGYVAYAAFFAVVCASFSWVGLSSLWARWRA
ncbi:MAG: glycosyltransferase [Polyangiaceae bacterium]|nr:glycosyltransferase [Polyangiaceae bacterium]